MSMNGINITIDRIDKAASVVSEDDGLHGTGVPVSPHYSDREGHSQSGSSELIEEYPPTNLPFPSELHEREERQPVDSVSIPGSHHHRNHHTSRSSSVRRRSSTRHTGRGQDPGAYKYRGIHPESPPPESVDSAEAYLRERSRPGPLPRQSYYGHVVPAPAAYAPSSSSGGSYGAYPPIAPPTNHMVPYAGMPPMQTAYGQVYPPMASPPTMGYPPAHHSYPHPLNHPTPSHVSSPYAPAPYVGTPTMMPYPTPPPGYFPAPYAPYPHQPYMDIWRVQSPPRRSPTPPTTATATAPAVDQEELVKKVEAMLLKEKEERQAREEAKEKELKAAAKEAADKVERAASDQKIAEDAAKQAATKAREEAEKKAAEEAQKAKDEAEAKLKEAEEAVAKAKKEAAEAAKNAAPPPEEKKAPIKFEDAVGRKFNFPFHLCAKWTSMEELIRQAFQHVDEIGQHVQAGHYDLQGPDGRIIIPAAWETTIEPDWKITMHMWPLPPKREDELLIPHLGLGDDILNLDDFLNPGKKSKDKGKGGSKTKKSIKGESSGGGLLSGWMLGGGRPKAKAHAKK